MLTRFNRQRYTLKELLDNEFCFIETENDHLAKIQSISLHSSVFEDANFLMGNSN